MSKLLRIAPAAVLLATTTFLAPVVPAKDKDKTAQTTEATGKEAKGHKEAKHKKASQNSASQSATGSTAAKSPK
jgi:hypothetical protein